MTQAEHWFNILTRTIESRGVDSVVQDLVVHMGKDAEYVQERRNNVYEYRFADTSILTYGVRPDGAPKLLWYPESKLVVKKRTVH